VPSWERALSDRKGKCRSVELGDEDYSLVIPKGWKLTRMGSLGEVGGREGEVLWMLKRRVELERKNRDR